MTDVVVVESPAKAKTINKYLGDNFTVLASFGHVRDLPPKDGSVRPDEGFAMDWAADERGSKQVAAIAKAVKGAGTLYLATDPDREGEAISWHVRAMLDEKHALKGVNVKRITFNEITKSAITYAIEHPRQLDQPLIEAYLARRALDYLVGFTLSPVLWRKLPGSRSAGRVQSVALRLVCEREAEIEVFRPREYWTIEAHCLTPAGAPFTAKLTHLEGKKLDQFDLNDANKAEAARQAVEAGRFVVASVERRRVKRNPPAPFTTSTLQQEASRKLGMGAQATMRCAQQLYEGVELHGETTGLITYMRTDGVQMAREAMEAIRSHVSEAYGADYIPAAPREYTSKAKNAQEAHEAIRPTDVSRTPDQVARYLSGEQLRLYDLVWKRAVASQMQSAELDQVAVDLASGGTRLRATGSIIAFDGFLKLYREDVDDAPETAAADESRMLPPMHEGNRIEHDRVTADQHFTQPPPRYSEASLVKKMEELGIGRPSTYASILTVLRDRNYVRMENKRFIPEDRGRLVTAFLTSFFERYVDTGFTASLEEQLDDISGGRADWRRVMQAFWDQFSRAVEQTRELKISDVIDALDKDLGSHFFPVPADGGDPRECPACRAGRLGLKLGRHGSFIGCSNYPACEYTRRLAVDGGEENGETLKEGKRDLGSHPENGEPITIRRGPYGLYVQQGDPDPEDKKKKPRRAAIPRGMDGEQMTLDQAIGLLSLPRFIGLHPERGEPIEAGIGRFGPYVKMGAIFASLDRDDDVLNVGINRAVDALAKKLDSIRSLGAHPGDKQPVVVRKGRFGPYVQHGNTVANLPRDVGMDDIGLDLAVSLLKEKGKALKPRPGSKQPAAKAKTKPAAKAPTKAKPASKPRAAAKKAS
ncbi:MAG: type I DNA topoisomerase [Acetobacteraceae bacterium]|nr:type I DNA topoisomerase [Acetobacteraceae bacterium]